MGEAVQYKTPNGGNVSGYLATAVGSTKHVVVIQEWWGLNDQIRGVCDRFAAAGFNALAPDLYRGRVTKEPDEANHLMTGLDWVGATEQDVRGAAQYLKTRGGRVAVMGFCMGGALTIIAGVKLPELDAACVSMAFHQRKPLTRATRKFRCKDILPIRMTGVRRRQ